MKFVYFYTKLTIPQDDKLTADKFYANLPLPADKFVLVWRRLNAIYPRRLWAMTVEGLRAPQEGKGCATWARAPSRRPLTEDDLVLDPLYVLRCDPRVFR